MYKLTLNYSNNKVKELFFYKESNALKHIIKLFIDILSGFYDVNMMMDDIEVPIGFWLYDQNMVVTIDKFIEHINNLDEEDRNELIYPISYEIDELMSF